MKVLDGCDINKKCGRSERDRLSSRFRITVPNCLPSSRSMTYMNYTQAHLGWTLTHVNPMASLQHKSDLLPPSMLSRLSGGSHNDRIVHTALKRAEANPTT